MTEEEKIEKPKEKYFYIEKEGVYKALWSIATTFIGASLALMLFAATHKPPVKPCGFSMPPQPAPYPCPLMKERGPHHGYHKMMPPSKEFRGHQNVKKADRPISPQKIDKPQPDKKVNLDKQPPKTQK